MLFLSREYNLFPGFQASKWFQWSSREASGPAVLQQIQSNSLSLSQHVAGSASCGCTGSDTWNSSAQHYWSSLHVRESNNIRNSLPTFLPSQMKRNSNNNIYSDPFPKPLKSMKLFILWCLVWWGAVKTSKNRRPVASEQGILCRSEQIFCKKVWRECGMGRCQRFGPTMNAFCLRILNLFVFLGNPERGSLSCKQPEKKRGKGHPSVLLQ